MDLNEINKVIELSSRIRDISANMELGDRNIRKYKDELLMDLQKSEQLITDLSAYLTKTKEQVENV